MATYFHGSTSEIESSAEGLQTLYLVNPNYVPYSDAAQNPTQNMLLVNPNTSIAAASSSNALNLANFSHAPPPNYHHHHHQLQRLVGVAIPSSNILGSTTTTTDNSTRLQHHGISGLHNFAATTATVAAINPRAHSNLWGSLINPTMSSATTAAETTPSNNSGYSAAVTMTDDCAEIGHHNHGHHWQGSLSLTLSSQQPSFRSLSGSEFGVPVSRGAGNGVVLGSKYLKAAQEALDEAVNVGEGICKGESKEGAKNNKEKMRANIESATSGIGDGGENSGSKQGSELSTAQRQELQMKKSKLVSMLDEVELRYRQYHNQMEMLISSFEQAAGFGAAKSYTALALKTISKQFRCLKDAISSQIKTTSKTLGDHDDCLGAKVEGSRLRYVDHHLRQQRALQQLGMIQHNAWRPQRGLPERAVSVLRAWLFEHFLHPYPKDSDKVMLAKQTGLTRSQVSNWFINARVRLWKPMVEEMYLEEIKEQEQNNDNTNRSKESSKELWSASATNVTHESSSGGIKLDHKINALHSSKPERFNNHNNASPTEISNSDNNSLSTSPIGGGGGGGSFQSHSGFHLAESSSEIQIRSPKKPRSSEMQQHCPGSMDMEMKPAGDKTREADTNFGNKDGYPLMTVGNENHGGGYGGVFSMEDIGRFNVTEQLAPRFHRNGVSLSLGLPHNENLPLSATQHGFLPQNMHLGGRLGMGTDEHEFCGITTNPPSSHSDTGYENIDIQNKKRFAAQLLRNFVS